MRVILARGPVVRALKRYDSGLRVRWSFEKKKWAVEAKVKSRKDLVPPVYFERLPNGEFREHMLAELSERYISYHGGYYVICWTPKIDWNLYEAIALRDLQRIGDRKEVLRSFDEDMDRAEKAKAEREQKDASERSYAAFDKLKWLNSRQPWNDPIGAGPL